MNFYALSAIINAISAALLGTLVLSRNKKHIVYQLYFAFTSSIFLWSVGYLFWQLSSTADQALFWSRIFMAAAIPIPFIFFHYVTALTKTKNKYQRFIVIGYIFTLIIEIINASSLLITSVSKKLFFNYWPNPTVIFHLFLVIWLYVVFYSIYLLIDQYKKAVDSDKKQLQFTIIGFLIGYGGGITNYFLWYDIPIPPVGNVLVSLHVFILAYAILRHRLMDISMLIKRNTIIGITYIFISLLLTVLIFLLYSVLSHFIIVPTTMIVGLSISTTLLLMKPLKYTVQWLIKYIIKQERIDVHYAGAKEQAIIAAGGNPKTYARFIAAEIMSQIPVECIHIILYDHYFQRFYTVYSTRNEKKIFDINERWLQELAKKPVIILQTTSNPKKLSEYQFMHKIFTSLSSTCAVPIKSDNRLLAVMLLGNRIDAEPFSQKDIQYLTKLQLRSARQIWSLLQIHHVLQEGLQNPLTIAEAYARLPKQTQIQIN